MCHDDQVAALAARLKKGGVDPEVMAALIWSIRPARLMTADDVEVIADRVSDKILVKMHRELRDMVMKTVIEITDKEKRQVYDEIRGLVRIELEQLIAEMGRSGRQSQEPTSNGVQHTLPKNGP